MVPDPNLWLAEYSGPVVELKQNNRWKRDVRKRPKYHKKPKLTGKKKGNKGSAITLKIQKLVNATAEQEAETYNQGNEDLKHLGLNLSMLIGCVYLAIRFQVNWMNVLVKILEQSGSI